MKFKYCPNCGFKLEEEFKYCPMCGTSIAELSSPRAQEEPTPPVYHERYERVPQESTDYYYERRYETRPKSPVEEGKELFRENAYDLALPYLLDYAPTDDVEAMYMLGYCYYMTRKQDPNCEKYLKIAADQGYTLAQISLGELYLYLAEENHIADFDRGYDPYGSISKERFDEAQEKCTRYYNLALKYFNLAKGIN